VNINVLIEIARVANFARDGDEVAQRLRDGLGGVDGDEAAKQESQKGSASGNPGAEGARAPGGPCGLLEKLGDVRIALIEDDRRLGQPGRGIFLQVKDLKVGNGSISRIDLMALGDQGLGKVIGPAGFGTLDLDQSSANGFAGGLRFAALDLVCDIRQTLIHFLFIAGIAAEEEIIHVEAIQHDLIAHGFDGANAVQGPAGVVARRSFPPPAMIFTTNNSDRMARIRPKPA